MFELQELLIEAEDPYFEPKNWGLRALIEAEDTYFELKNGGLRSVKRLFEHKEVLAQLQFIHSEVRLG